MGARMEGGYPPAAFLRNSNPQPDQSGIVWRGVLTGTCAAITAWVAKHKWGFVAVGAVAGTAAAGTQYWAYKVEQRRSEHEQAALAVEIFKQMKANHCLIPSQEEQISAEQMAALQANANNAQTLYKQIVQKGIENTDIQTLRTFTQTVKCLHDHLLNRAVVYKTEIPRIAHALVEQAIQAQTQALINENTSLRKDIAELRQKVENQQQSMSDAIAQQVEAQLKKHQEGLKANAQPSTGSHAEIKHDGLNSV